MALYHILVLAIVQGLDSTDQLLRTSRADVECSGWPDQGLLVDVAVHVGTLFAVVVYFWRDLWAMALGLFRLVTSGPGANWPRIALATMPGCGRLFWA